MEDRNCNCNNQGFMNNNECEFQTPQGINAAFGYNTAAMSEDNGNCCSCNCNCTCKDETRCEMLKNIRCLSFAIVDISEYLNTHPDDQKALCLHKEYCRQLKELKDKYQKVYGPLSIYYPCNKWRWLEEPWPWEGDGC